MYSIELMDDKYEKLQYNAGDLPIKSDLSRREDYPTSSVLSHWHTDFEFSYVTNGILFYNVNGKSVKLSAGQMIFVNSGQMHFGYWDEPCECDFICTIFHPSLLHEASRYLETISGSNSLPYHIFDRNDLSQKALFDLIVEINDIVAEKTEGFEMPLLSRIFELSFLLYKQTNKSGAIPRKDEKKLEIMRLMTGFISRNYSQKMSLTDIAEAGAVCRSECCKIFREYLGKTPFDYLNEYRIVKGADMLRESDKSVTEIALACGFSSSSYFTERFSGAMNCTPTSYRERKSNNKNMFS